MQVGKLETGDSRLTSPQSNLRIARPSSTDKTTSKLLGSHSPSMLTRSSYMATAAIGCHWAATEEARVFRGTFMHMNFASTMTSILNLTMLKKGNLMQNSTVYRGCGNTVNFSHTSRLLISLSVYPYVAFVKYWTKISQNVEILARNSPFPLRHVNFHLTHECPGPLHLPRQTTARSLYALPHNATNAIGYNGTPQICPETAPSSSTITTKI